MTSLEFSLNAESHRIVPQPQKAFTILNKNVETFMLLMHAIISQAVLPTAPTYISIPQIIQRRPTSINSRRSRRHSSDSKNRIMNS